MLRKRYLERSHDMAKYSMLNKADVSLDVIILFIIGMIMLITGTLLFPVSAGILPYYENGLYGLLLFIFALQMITLGKTPFREMRQSKLLLIIGVVIASIGIVTCFIPDIFNPIPRILLSLCFGPGGILLLIQMVFSKEKLRSWLQYGRSFHHLIFGCGAVYLLSMLIGMLIWDHSLFSTSITAVTILIYGVAIVYLAETLRRIYRMYPEAEKSREGDIDLSSDKAMILVTAIFMQLLGILLIPVNWGLLPFSGSAQLGLLMVIFAVQMLAFGNTPIGPFFRSWLMILFGFIFAALGIISCIIPEILVSPLTVLIGALNIIGGITTLGKTCLPLFKKGRNPHLPTPRILVKLYVTQLAMNLVAILFGVSMFVSHLIPGQIIGVILTANGCILLYLLHILSLIDKIRAEGTN